MQPLWAVVVAQEVAHRTTDREVLGLIPASQFYHNCVLNQVPLGAAALLICLYKMLSSAACGKTSLIRSV